MKNVTLDLSTIHSWDDFHDLFAATFDFPGYYGRNMDAWNDCMGDAALSEEGGIFLHLDGAAELKANHPQIWEALNECAAFLNYHQHDSGGPPVIALSYFA